MEFIENCLIMMYFLVFYFWPFVLIISFVTALINTNLFRKTLLAIFGLWTVGAVCLTYYLDFPK